LSNPDNENFFIKIYNRVPLQSIFIEDFLIKDKPAFVASNKNLSTSHAVEIIKQAGGKAICAHPSFNVMRGYDFELMKELILRNKFDGLESINIQYDKSNGDKKFDMVKEFKDFANTQGLLISGGSDYHSSNFKLLGNHSEIGLSNEDYRVTIEQVEAIIKV
jgi:predicted metal-dependent phosphoesterase TrpH